MTMVEQFAEWALDESQYENRYATAATAEEYPPAIRCGNRAYHGVEHYYHYSVAEVRECYAYSGRLSKGRTQAQMQDVSEMARLVKEEREAKEAEDREKARSRYAAWRSIPVGSGDYANYARQVGGSVILYQVQRPSKGQYAGKTYVKRHSGDGLTKMGWVESGEAMDAIAADPMAAAILYGRSAMRCAICHRALTDDKAKGPDGLTSIQRGIGPRCAQKVGVA